MQKFIYCLLTICFVLPATAMAECEVRFEWTPQGVNNKIAGYMIFCREEGQAYDYSSPVWEGDNTFQKCRIDGLDKSKTYFFVIRAVDREDNQSYDSPEVEYSYNLVSDAGLGGLGEDVDISSSTSFSSCFIQTLSGSTK
jgi:hypothetical protein